MAIGEPDLVPFDEDDDVDPTGSGFDTVRRGFAPDQVAVYLKRVATSVLSLQSRLEETRSELLETRRERDSARAALQSAAGEDPYESVSERLTGLVRNFDHQVGGLLRDAEVEAERVQSEVRLEADRILAEARGGGRTDHRRRRGRRPTKPRRRRWCASRSRGSVLGA